MSSTALARCLVGMNPPDWYEMLNVRVFFWIETERLNKQLKAYQTRPQVVIIIKASALISAFGERVTLTGINRGSTIFKPAIRGKGTFVALAEWEKTGWQSEAMALGKPLRPNSRMPAELTVLDAVPDVMRFVDDFVELQPGQTFTHQNR